MAGLGFPSGHRLHKAVEFSAVFSGRRLLRGDRFDLMHRSNGLPHARLGLVIPKRQARHATVRNLVKRQAREAFRSRGGKLPALDLVLRLTKPLKGPVDELQRRALRSEIESLLSRLPQPEPKELLS
ncbi:MAG: ribonuclease P protein component [Rhodocyclaceae bacterium]|nr:ribonuclease P protein component [Rhodocyclaceae bacterium]